MLESCPRILGSKRPRANNQHQARIKRNVRDLTCNPEAYSSRECVCIRKLNFAEGPKSPIDTNKRKLRRNGTSLIFPPVKGGDLSS